MNFFSGFKYILQKYFFSLLPFLYIFIQLQKKNKKYTHIAHRVIYRYFRIRHKLGKVDIPYIEIVLTTKCTLRCESCNNLMQYFHPKNQYTCTLQGIIQSLDRLFANIDSIQSMRIIGGEPLLFKDLDKVITYLGQQKKLLSFNIVTNATMLFKEKALHALQSCPNAIVHISDYSVSPNIRVPLKKRNAYRATTGK